VKTSKIRLNLTVNSFIFGRINREIAPRTFSLQTCKRRISKLRLNFFHCSLLYIHHAVTWERLKSWKYVAHIFEKITKFWFVKFSPVEEIASKFASADFQNFCRLASKKVPEVPVFFRLRGNTVVLYASLSRNLIEIGPIINIFKNLWRLITWAQICAVRITTKSSKQSSIIWFLKSLH